MSSISKAPSNNNMISFESSEESSWTKYFEDFFNNEHKDIDHHEQKCSINSFSGFGDGSSLVSDAANSMVGEKKLTDQNAQSGSIQYIKRLSFKKRKKIITSVVDHDLEDTASSPINSPKVFTFLLLLFFLHIYNCSFNYNFIINILGFICEPDIQGKREGRNRPLLSG